MVTKHRGVSGIARAMCVLFAGVIFSVSGMQAFAKPVPLSPEDRAEIQELLHRYSHYVDNRLGDAWASVFTPDGRLEFYGQVYEGRDKLAAWAKEDRDFYPTHFVGDTIMVQTAPGQVHARSMVIVTIRMKNYPKVAGPSPTQMLGVGVYDDQIVKTKDGWRIRLRKAGSTGEMPVDPDFLP